MKWLYTKSKPYVCHSWSSSNISNFYDKLYESVLKALFVNSYWTIVYLKISDDHSFEEYFENEKVLLSWTECFCPVKITEQTIKS